MSRIDELIQQHCPNGVEFMTLGEVGKFIRGNGLQKSDLIGAGFPAIHYGQVHTSYGISATETVSFVTATFASKLRKAEPGDLVIATTSEDDEALAKAVAWVGETSAAVSGDAYIYRHSLEPKFVSYFFQSQHFQTQKGRGITGTKVRRISGETLAKIKIPVPPLDIQKEIVRILDTFDQLETALKEELEGRKKQYDYYRDHLLSFEGGALSVRWVKMNEVFVMRAGQHLSATAISPTQNADSKVPVYGGNGLRGFGNTPSHNGKYLLIGRQGALCGNVKRTSGEFYATEHAVVTGPSNEMNVDYAFHLLTAMNLNKFKSAGAQPGLTVGKLGEVMVPVPPLDAQLKIAAVLDKFDYLVNDLNVGLPAELYARRRQYEYYRDKLLTFQEIK